MNSTQRRKMAAEFAVAIMACGAAHFFFIAPAQQKLRVLRSESEARSAQTVTGPSLTADQLAVFGREARIAIDRINERSAAAKDETRLFSEIMSLANVSGVQIEQLQPVERASHRPGATTPAAPPPTITTTPPEGESGVAASTTPRDTSVGYNIVVTAKYGRLVTFLHRLPSELGFTAVRGIRLEPGDGADPDLVRAHIETEHFTFDVSDLAKLASTPTPEGGPDGGSN